MICNNPTKTSSRCSREYFGVDLGSGQIENPYEITSCYRGFNKLRLKFSIEIVPNTTESQLTSGSSRNKVIHVNMI